MKESTYNIYIPYGKDWIIYNTVSGSIGKVDEEMKDLLQHNPSSIAGKTADDFKKANYLIDDDVDEKKILQVLMEKARYSSDTLIATLVLTYSCNLSCPYCYENKKPVSMSMEMVKRSVEFIKTETLEHGYHSIVVGLYGGEPLLNVKAANEALSDLSSFSNEKGINLQWYMPTNGTLLTEQMLDNLLRFGSTPVVQITLDGPKELHDMTRKHKNGGGTWDEIMKAIKLLIEKKVKLHLRVNVTRDNYAQLSTLLSELEKEVGTKGYSLYPGHVEPYTPVCGAYEPHCLSNKEMGKVAISLYQEMIERGFEIYLKPERKWIACEAVADNSWAIDPEGVVYRCWQGIGRPGWEVGVLDEDSKIKDVQPIYYEWLSRNPFAIKKCKDCKLLPICGGGCTADAIRIHGTPHSADCSYLKESLEEQIRIYVQQKYGTA